MDWVCSGCGRHFSWAVSCCPYCIGVKTTVTTGGTQPTSDNNERLAIALWKRVVDAADEELTDGEYLGMLTVLVDEWRSATSAIS
jgi:hypothetical protein